MEMTTPSKRMPWGSSKQWWVWSAWVEWSDGFQFVYGCAAQLNHTSNWQDEETVDIDGVRITFSQCVIADAEFERFRSGLNEHVIRLGDIHAEQKPEQAIVAAREVMQSCLGHGRVRASLYYTLPNLDGLLTDEKLFKSLLAKLQAELNLPFTDTYASRLGNFEIFHLPPWLDLESPVVIEFAARGLTGVRDHKTLEICRTDEMARQGHIAHLVCRTGGDVVYDQIIKLDIGVMRHPVLLPDAPDEFTFWLFSENDLLLLHYESSAFCTQVNVAMGIHGRSLVIDDALSARASQVRDKQTEKICTVTATQYQRSVIGGEAKGSWQSFAKEMKAFTSRGAEGDDRWFPKGISGEIGAIAYLDSLLSGAKVKRAILVDPWFGVDSVNRLLLRLSSQDIQLTVITSWTSKNPDTNTLVSDKDNPTAELEAFLNQVRHLLNPSITVINLVDGQSQAFHDRYLIVYPHDGVPKTYLLSNSINKMAGNWPFAMSLLSPSVGAEVRNYTEALCNEQDIARGRSLTKTFLWKTDAK